jgi:hypothetical protein
VGLLAAFIPGIAYATVYSYFLDGPNPLGLPEVAYEPVVFSAHTYTVRFVMSAMGGLIGLFALVLKNKKVYLGVGAIAVSSFGLMLPAFNKMRVTIPEVRLFDVPWIGAVTIIVGICLMFLGLSLKKEHIPKASFLSLPLMLAVYLIQPILIAFNYLPRVIFGNTFNLLNWFVFLAAILLMIWGLLWPYRSNLKKIIFETGTFQSQTEIER